MGCGEDIMISAAFRKIRWEIESAGRAAKPPSPVQIRAAPPILNLVNAVTCGRRILERPRRFETIRVQIDEQSVFDRFNGTAVHSAKSQAAMGSSWW
jgi:hypothetical protein